MTRARLSAVAMAVVLNMATMAACESNGGSPSATPVASTAGTCPIPFGPIGVAVSGRRNSPAPTLPLRIHEIVHTMLDAVPRVTTGPLLSLVQLDSRPDVLATAKFYTDAGTGTVADDDRANFLSDFENSVNAVRSNDSEIDLLAGLDKVARTVGTGSGTTGTIAVIDSGISTSGALDFSAPGLLDASVEEVIEFLQRNGEIPDLSGINVIFAGIGDVAPPQADLRPGQRAHLVELLTKIAKAGRASCVEIVQFPRAGAAPERVPPVKIIPTSLPPAFETVLPDNEIVGFLPDQAVFRDPNAAREALKTLATSLKNDSKRRILLTGTTARVGSPDGQIRLATNRAEAVKNLLVSLGAAPTQIDIRGLGSYFQQYVPDLDAKGMLLPGPAQRNRTVRIDSA